MTMTIELSDKLYVALQVQARAKGISAAGLARQVLEHALAHAATSTAVASPELPILHLGALGDLHRRDIHRDVR